ncbi:MAG: carbamoyltransferase HypF [Candidatus Hadarchaeia archaeon]
MKIHADLEVEGIVQGVGFRPFCYRTATVLGLSGTVKNTGNARVEIILEGEENAIEEFVKKLKHENPPIARVDNVKISKRNKLDGLKEFKILESDEEKSGTSSVLPPDIGICDDCRREMFSPEDRRYLYPFISCINCGPRFSIIKDVPYDRKRTSMKKFSLCKLCQNEYTDPSNRRYHGQTISCSKNGPELRLYTGEGEKIESESPIRKAAKMLDEEKTGAIKGIGGIHIAAKASDDSVIAKLRKTFARPQQPFAIMAKDLNTVKSFAKVNEMESEILTSNKRPITLLEEKEKSSLSELISPKLNNIGVMLPYSGIHLLLFHYGSSPAYVMTSANMPGLPMVIENSEAFRRLGKKLDFLLLHDRKIVNRCDDSVIRISGGTPAFLRRSRGYAPTPIETSRQKNKKKILAVGADLDNTISVTEGGRIYPSQYIGDVENIETEEYLKKTLNRFMDFLGIESLDLIVRDKHPEFETTRIARELGKKLNAEIIDIQHHRAHVHSLMAEHEVKEIIGITADGIGYGDDGNIWGGEVFAGNEEKISRIGGIESYMLPGGDLATKYPSRSVAGILWGHRDADHISRVLETHCKEFVREGEIRVTLKQLETNLNTPIASSTGRVLDAASCLLKICGERTYEGEPAMKLESVASKGKPENVELHAPRVDNNNLKLFRVSELLEGIVENLQEGKKRRDIASGVQRELADSYADIAIETSKEIGITNVGVSGGVFYNDAITSRIKERIEKEDLNFYQNIEIPPGDGGISIGQALGAMKKIG